MTRKILSYILYTFSSLLIATAIFATVASYILKDLKYYTQLSLQHLEEKTGYRITLDDINWSIAQGAGVRIDNLCITDVNRNIRLFSARKVQIMTALFPLFKKHFVVSRIFVDNPIISVSRDSDGQWSFFNIPSLSFDYTGTQNRLFDFSISLKKIFITNGKVLYHDDAQHVATDLDHVKFQIIRTHKTETYTISLYGEQNINGKIGNISLDGSLTAAPSSNLAQNLIGNASLSVHSIDLSCMLPYVRDYYYHPESGTLFDASFNVNLFPDLKLSASGKITSQNLSVISPGEKIIAIGPCSLSLEGQIDHTAVTCNKFLLSLFENITINGSLALSNMHDTSIPYDLTFDTNQIPLSQVKRLLSFADTEWPWYKSIAGKLGDGDITIKNIRLCGLFSDTLRDRISDLEGEISLNNIIATIAKSIPPLRITDAQLQIAGDSLFGDINAQLLTGDSHAIHADILGITTSPVIKLTITSHSSAPQLTELINVLLNNSGLMNNFRFTSGLLSAKSHVQYNSKLKITSEIDLTNTSYQIAGSIVKPEGLRNIVYLKSDNAFDNETFHPFSFDCNIVDSAQVAGTVNNVSPFNVSGTYSMNSFDIASVNLQSLPAGIELKGLVSGRGSFSFPSPPSIRFPVHGTLSLEEFSLRDKQIDSSLIDVTFAANLNEHFFSLAKCTARVGETNGTVTGELHSVLPPQGKLMINAHLFDIDDFVGVVEHIQKLFENKASGPPTSSPTPPTGKNLFLHTDLDMDMIVQKLNFLKWDFLNGTCRYRYINGTMVWENVLINGGNGPVHGSVLFDFSSPLSRTLKFATTRSDVDFLWAIPSLQKKETIIGKMNLIGEFSSTFTKKSEIVDNMQGTCHVLIKDGVMKKFTTLSKILAMLNIYRIVKLDAPNFLAKGMPFDSITSDLDLKSSVMMTNNLMLKGPAMNLSAVGSINLAKEETDLIVGAQILETIGRILGNIPVAGEFFTGKDKSLTIGYFHVKGPYEDASVTPMPIKSISGPVLKIFKSLLDIPHDLFSSDKDESDHNKNQSSEH